MPYSYDYPRAALTVDCVVFGFDETELKVLLIQRGLAPFKGKWALPGGFVRVDETVDEAARRELTEETGLTNVFLEQLYTFGALKRDPRERVVSVAYYALVNLAEHPATGATDAADAGWFPASKPPALAFDHSGILTTALERLQGKVRYEPIGFELLPEKFSLSQLQHLYEAVLDTELDKRNFRKKILSMDLLIPLKEQLRTGAHRPAQLFRFDTRRYAALKRRGFNFEL
jgi:ADP-ribose pyrophosphatase YjhB (NUDIX family)